MTFTHTAARMKAPLAALGHRAWRGVTRWFWNHYIFVMPMHTGEIWVMFGKLGFSHRRLYLAGGIYKDYDRETLIKSLSLVVVHPYLKIPRFQVVWGTHVWTLLTNLRTPEEQRRAQLREWAEDDLAETAADRV